VPVVHGAWALFSRVRRLGSSIGKPGGHVKMGGVLHDETVGHAADGARGPLEKKVIPFPRWPGPLEKKVIPFPLGDTLSPW
jgi:hypothetical protein